MKDDRLYLSHILQAIDRIEAYTAAGLDSFRNGFKTQDAVIWNLQIVGEASKSFRSKREPGAS